MSRQHPLLQVRFIVGGALILAVVLMVTFVPWLLYPVDPTIVVGERERPPSREHLLGTDERGRDVLAQVIHGTRASLFIGLITAAVGAAIGVGVGVVSGFRGGILDEVLMLFANIVLAFPMILLLLMVAFFLPVRGPIVVAVLMGLTIWPWVARAVRSQIMSLKERPFVFMARMSNFSNTKIAVVELLPNMGAYIFMTFVILMASAMVTEAGLSMIGVGVTEGKSLGIMLFWAQTLEAVRRGIWWWFIPPGAILVIITSSLLVISTALDEYFSPRLKGS